MIESAIMILTYLRTHPQTRHYHKSHYQNIASFSLDDTVLFPDGASLFPDNRLRVVRLPQLFAYNNPELTAWLLSFLPTEIKPQTNNMWLTTSHITQAHALLIEVSFE